MGGCPASATPPKGSTSTEGELWSTVSSPPRPPAASTASTARRLQPTFPCELTQLLRKHVYETWLTHTTHDALLPPETPLQGQ